MHARYVLPSGGGGVGRGIAIVCDEVVLLFISKNINQCVYLRGTVGLVIVLNSREA